MGLIGLVLLLGLAYGLSRDRGAIRLSTVLWGLGLQLTLAILVLKTPFRMVFEAIGAAVNQMMLLAEAGTQFVFGELGSSQGPIGTVLAFQILPLIVFISSLFAVLYFLGVMQQAVRGIALVMQRVMGASGAESLNVAANIFMGQSEAPLTIRPYLDKLTRSELMTVMTGGMATISGALLVAYVRIGGVPMEHMLTAVIMTAPGAILMAKMLEPETETPETFGRVPRESHAADVNVIDAAARGASEGLYLALNVGAVLIAFVALIAVMNGLLGWIHELPHMGWMPQALEDVFALLFAPVAWVMGVPWSDAGTVGHLLGTRMVLNEFVAYAELGKTQQTLQPESFLIAGYARCGLANLGLLGIQVGGD
ncbi:MAG: NupC/NupG family nucleoside CNT transporter [Bryobacterales bacterium]|nr:NupC/NupG family nucleoside CNT transporter [Bryobacterales bacterium]